ncbi:MAG: hypothetical protein WC783_03280 [Candidatus Paceibacterota bacterium]|jgi:hypothetical protein
MKKLLLCILVVSLASCVKYGNTSSEILYEEAIILNATHTPSSHDVVPTMGVGMSFKGDLVMMPTTRIIDVPEKWGVIFKCKHGEFIVERTNPTLYNKLKDSVGKKVNVSYKEIYNIKYEKVPDPVTGKKIWYPVSKTLKDYDFIDADIING